MAVGTPEDLAERIKRERLKRQWTLQNLVDEVGRHGVTTHRNTVLRIENAQREVRAHELAAFAQVFETTIEDLLQPIKDLDWALIAKLNRKIAASTFAVYEGVAGWAEYQVEVFELAFSNEDLAEAASFAKNGAFEELERLMNSRRAPSLKWLEELPEAAAAVKALSAAVYDGALRLVAERHGYSWNPETETFMEEERTTDGEH